MGKIDLFVKAKDGKLCGTVLLSEVAGQLARWLLSLTLLTLIFIRVIFKKNWLNVHLEYLSKKIK